MGNGGWRGQELKVWKGTWGKSAEAPLSEAGCQRRADESGERLWEGSSSATRRFVHNSLRSRLIFFWLCKRGNSGSEMSFNQVTQLSGFQIIGGGSRRPVLEGPNHFFLPPPLHGVEVGWAGRAEARGSWS